MSKPRSAYRACPNVSKYLEEKLIQRRKELKISQSTLAARAGLTRNCVQQMECHEHLPLPSTMFRLLEALEFSKEETAEFWLEIEDAYGKDRALRDAANKGHKAV